MAPRRDSGAAADGAASAAAHRQYVAHVIPHTHWDREWYEPFQVFRARLVDVVDAVIQILDHDPAFKSFTLDGQAVILDDYLEARLERRGDLERLVRAGRLHIGPWYVLADEFLVSPEALIRNLLHGQGVCAAFGSAMPVGYTPDSFGHIAQLPLLLRGFGIDNVVFERGVGDEGETLRGEFAWTAADGSNRVFAVHLLGTYSAIAALGHQDWELRDSYRPEMAVKHARAVLYGSETSPEELPQWLGESLARVDGGVCAYATGPNLVLMNGSDHLFPQANLPAVIGDLNDALPEVAFTHSDLPTFINAARRPLDELEQHRGEFRGSRYQHVLPGVLSTRMYLKQANEEAQTLLERYTEPLTSFARLCGGDYPAGLVTAGWKLLLKNHPHDSICGCSVDAVHREMMTRFEGVQQLADALCNRALDRLGTPRLQRVTVFNPQPFARQAAVTIERASDSAPSGTLVAVGPRGEHLATQVEVFERYSPGNSDRKVRLERLTFLAPLRPLALNEYTLRESRERGDWHNIADVSGALIRLANEHLLLEVATDGEVFITDRAAPHRHALELAFEDVADAGDEYDFSPVADDKPILVSSPSRPPELIENGPVRARVRLDYRLELPERLCDDRKRRIGAVSLPATLKLELCAAARSVRLHGRIDNRACDHRLRLRVASGCETDHVWADGHFTVARRPCAPAAGQGWFQAPQPTNHQRRFVAASDGRRGLAIINRGLPEYEPLAGDPGVVVAITLIRAVGWLSRNDLRSRPQGAGPSLPTPEAQCLGEHEFELALCPFAGNWWEGPLLAEADAFSAPAKAFADTAVSWPGLALEVDPPFVLSCVKWSQTGSSLIVRVWNAAPEPMESALRLAVAPREAYVVRLDETRVGPLAAGKRIGLRLRASQVETLELVFAEGVNSHVSGP